jgi:Zn-dependent protease
MKPLGILGIILLVIGIGSLVYNVIPVHHTEQVAKVGPFTANEDKENDVVISPVISVLVLVAGGAIIAVSARKA